jgi:hypothetical protein
VKLLKLLFTKAENSYEKYMFIIKYYLLPVLARIWQITTVVRPPIFPGQPFFLGLVLSVFAEFLAGWQQLLKDR